MKKIIIGLLITIALSAVIYGCPPPADKLDRAAVKALDLPTRTAFWKEQLTRSLAAPLNDAQRDIVIEYIKIVPQILEADTTAEGFFSTDLGLKVLELSARSKAVFRGQEGYYLFEQPNPLILAKYAHGNVHVSFIQTSMFSVPMDCTCAGVISACAWEHGCFDGSCKAVINCGPFNMFQCTSICHDPLMEELDGGGAN